MVSSKTGLLSRDDKYFQKGVEAPQFRTVVEPKAKLGHECPDGCLRAQLYQGDHGLTCPECRTVFVAEKGAEAEAVVDEALAPAGDGDPEPTPEPTPEV